MAQKIVNETTTAITLNMIFDIVIGSNARIEPTRESPGMVC